MPRREGSSQTERRPSPRPGARWLGILFGVAAGAALFMLAAPHVSLWIGRTLASEAPAPTSGPTAASAPIDWSEGAGEAPAALEPVPAVEAAPAAPAIEDALKGRAPTIDPPADAPLPESDAPPNQPPAR